MSDQQQNYRLETQSGQGLPTGIALYHITGQSQDELIAIIQSTSSLSLDGDDFSFLNGK